MSAMDDFRKEKQASGFFKGFGKALGKDALGTFGRAAGHGATTAVVSAGITGVGIAAAKIVDALTKRRDFTSMMDANPDLAEQHANDPKRFNQMFTTLRMMNPQFSGDPIVAGTYMRRMSDSPMSAGGIAVEALGHRDSTKSPILENFVRGGLEGAKGAVKPKSSANEP